MRKILFVSLFALLPIAASAQSGTNSPYSQYGLGLLSERSTGFNRGMNGLGVGFRMHNQVNYLNPASYSAIDSATFIFDAGFSLQMTNFSEEGVKKNANNADFEYAVAGFRLARHLGISLGIIPFTNVGYDYSRTFNVGSDKYDDVTTATNIYSGSGGLHETYLGLGFEPFKGFSIGFNAAYIWGNITHSVVNSYSESTVNTVSKYYTSNINNYRLTFGAQYTAQMSRRNAITVGATFSPGHKLGSDPTCLVINRNSQTGVADTARYVASNAYELPTEISAGFMWNYAGKLRFGADYNLQKWGAVVTPVYAETGNDGSYTATKNMFSDRHKVTLGGEYVNDERSRNFFQRIRYRVGASYATDYLKINGKNGPKELSVSAGFGIPIVNGYNNRSILNISGQWVRNSASGLIRENTFRINVGLTFNEEWFSKWKMQ
ncbi:MAG: hypothetical protein PUG09_09140 [Prevotella sp.]|nr:hypothetical protein [Prevotella sp.]